MSRWVEWWLNDAQRGDWALPAAHVQGLRLIGGAIVGADDELRFVPNRLEARFGGRGRTIPHVTITGITMGRRRLRITIADGEPLTFWINRRRSALNYLAGQPTFETWV